MFPIGGLNRKGPYHQVPPYTTYDCLNVWPRERIKNRTRGGSRPGLEKTHPEALGGAVRLLNTIVFVPGVSETTGSREEGIFFGWHSNFDNGEFGDDWVKGYEAVSGPHSVAVLPRGGWYAYSTYSQDQTDSFFSTGEIDFTKPTKLEIRVLPNANGLYGGQFYLYIGCTNTETGADFIYACLDVSSENAGEYSGWLEVIGGEGELVDFDTDGGFATDEIGWFTLAVDGEDAKVYWRNYLVAELSFGSLNWHSAGGVKIGTVASDGYEARFGGVRVQGYFAGFSTDATYFSPGGARTMLMAAANGDLYYEKLYGSMEAVTTDLSLNSNALLESAQFGQKLYIADYGDLRISGDDGTVSGSNLDAASVADWTAHSINVNDDVVVLSNVSGDTIAQTYTISSISADALTLDSAPGDGTCTYRVERAPKVYNADTETLTIFTASTGQVPTGNPLMVRYLDRMVLAGGEIAPHVWYMSRRGDETDWDYSQSDSEAAVAGTASEAGVPGTAITTLVPYKDDYLLIGCRNALWLLRGDPRYGGSLDSISRNVGVIGQDAWCIGPGGEFVFLSANGLYALPSIHEGAKAIPLSSHALPDELKKINTSRVIPSLQYDVQFNGIHLFLTSRSSESGSHWWIDWETKTFWPVAYSENHEPTCTHVSQTMGFFGDGVIFGGKDGYLRRLDDQIETDDGTEFTSYVCLGPIALGADGQIGKILKMDAEIAENSGNVTWSLRRSNTFEGVTVESTDSDSGTWTAGLNASVWPACAGQVFTLILSGTGEPWAFEQVIVTSVTGGARRLM